MKHFKLAILLFIIITALCSCNPGQQSGVTPTPEITAEEKIEIAEKIYKETQSVENIKVDTTEQPSEAESEKEVEKAETTVSVNETKPTVNDNITTCSIIVRCDSVLSNMDKLKEGKELIIPQNGIIYENKSAVFYEEETVFNVLSRELKKSKIHFEYEYTPMYNSTYIEGIGNLYEFDCGDLSGWLYKVNGKTPGCGCSQYVLKNGDVVEFLYSCTMGVDVGGYKEVTGE